MTNHNSHVSVDSTENMACTEQTRTDNSCLPLAVVAINIPIKSNSKGNEKLYYLKI